MFCVYKRYCVNAQAEEVDTSISELARVVSGERALIEECGDLLSKEYTAQVCPSMIQQIAHGLMFKLMLFSKYCIKQIFIHFL